MNCPVISLGASVARYNAAPAISCGVLHSGSPLGSNSLDMSVSTHPGLRAFTRIPCGLTDFANEVVYPATPHFEAVYAPRSSSAILAADEAIFMTVPLPCSTIWGTTALQQRNVPCRSACLTVLRSTPACVSHEPKVRRRSCNRTSSKPAAFRIRRQLLPISARWWPRFRPGRMKGFWSWRGIA